MLSKLFLTATVVLGLVLSASARLVTDQSVCLSDFECKGNTYCHPTAHTCRPRAAKGQSCFLSNECRRSLFCNVEGQCEPRKVIGAACNPFTSSACVDGADCDFDSEKCVSVAPVSPRYGAVCESDSECVAPVDDFLPDGAPVLCNIPSGSSGLCQNPDSLIKTLGADCSQSNDLCDARRGLSCRFSAPMNKSVCMQRGRYQDVRLTRFCTPGSELSRCENRNGVPMECRLGRLGYEDIFSCEPRQEVLSVGQACHRGDIGVCGDGLECKLIPSVLTRHRPTWKSCVKVVGAGEGCSDIFTTQCGEGLTCENKVCVEGEKPMFPSNTHVGETLSCEGELPCARGLVCPATGGRRLCSRPTVIQSAGEPCFFTTQVNRQCAAGLTCRRRSNGRAGLLKCRK